MNNDSLFLIQIIDHLITFTGIVSVLIVGFMPLYFIKKYKTYAALAYWDYATKKERMVMSIGYIGFLLAFLLGIIISFIKNQ